MPTRLIREGILTSERVNKLSSNAELFYRRLMSVADDHGRFPAIPMLLRASCYPLKLDSVKEDSISKHLNECEEAGLIVLYTVETKRYLEIQDFGQRVQSKSKYPAKTDTSVNDGEPPGKTALVGGGGVVGGEDGGGGEDGQPPPCPHKEIVALYHEILPSLPVIKAWTDNRAEHLRARWKEDAKRQDLAYWRKFFDHVAASDWLMGRKAGRDGRVFREGLAWMVNPDNFAKIIEGKYHDGGQA